MALKMYMNETDWVIAKSPEDATALCVELFYVLDEYGPDQHDRPAVYGEWVERIICALESP